RPEVKQVPPGRGPPRVQQRVETRVARGTAVVLLAFKEEVPVGVNVIGVETAGSGEPGRGQSVEGDAAQPRGGAGSLLPPLEQGELDGRPQEPLDPVKPAGEDQHAVGARWRRGGYVNRQMLALSGARSDRVRAQSPAETFSRVPKPFPRHGVIS